MADSAIQACYAAVYNKLKNGGNAGGRVFPDMGDDSAVDPNLDTWAYWVYNWSGGGESNQRRKGDANLVLAVKCVSNDLDAAFTGAAQISALLNNQGVQDIVPATGAYVTSPLSGGANWVIKTSTQEDVFHLTEVIEETGETVYHDGAYYRFIMEAI